MSKFVSSVVSWLGNLPVRWRYVLLAVVSLLFGMLISSGCSHSKSPSAVTNCAAVLSAWQAADAVKSAAEAVAKEEYARRVSDVQAAASASAEAVRTGLQNTADDLLCNPEDLRRYLLSAGAQ